jgi:KDO2-lipid IV(A) lauroyltransferase
MATMPARPPPRPSSPSATIVPLHRLLPRTRFAHWSLEFATADPTRDADGHRRLLFIARDMNRSFERAIRRDPANWFWVHRRWKPAL